MAKELPKNGEYVRVVLEGKVSNRAAHEAHPCFYLGENEIWLNDDHLVSVEPVKHVFQPGQTVRHKFQREATYLLTHEGYVCLGDNHFRSYNTVVGRNNFHSGNYELVK